MKRNELIEQVKHAVHELEPEAKIILYGSRSRGEALPESDWDFLILVNQPLDRDQIAEVKNALYDLELKTNTVMSSIIRTLDEWNSPRYAVLPFKRIVEQEGLLL
jgi:predicted nucleotidyltransferase